MTRNADRHPWTALVSFGPEAEEVTVLARDSRHARRLVNAELRANYVAGGRVVQLVPGNGSFGMEVY